MAAEKLRAEALLDAVACRKIADEQIESLTNGCLARLLNSEHIVDVSIFFYVSTHCKTQKYASYIVLLAKQENSNCELAALDSHNPKFIKLTKVNVLYFSWLIIHLIIFDAFA